MTGQSNRNPTEQATFLNKRPIGQKPLSHKVISDISLTSHHIRENTSLVNVRESAGKRVNQDRIHWPRFDTLHGLSKNKESVKEMKQISRVSSKHFEDIFFMMLGWMPCKHLSSWGRVDLNFWNAANNLYCHPHMPRSTYYHTLSSIHIKHEESTVFVWYCDYLGTRAK